MWCILECNDRTVVDIYGPYATRELAEVDALLYGNHPSNYNGLYRLTDFDVREMVAP